MLSIIGNPEYSRAFCTLYLVADFYHFVSLENVLKNVSIMLNYSMKRLLDYDIFLFWNVLNEFRNIY